MDKRIDLMIKDKLPVHTLGTDSKHINVLPLDYDNPYDYKREHRHTYFELMFIERGGGNQLIDFKHYEVRDYSCYIIFPHQVHLMNRKQSSGMIIQFTEERIGSTDLLGELKRLAFCEEAAIVFENKKQCIEELTELLSLLKKPLQREGAQSSQTASYLLQALIALVLEGYCENEHTVISEDKRLWLEFIQLIEGNYHRNWKVQDYIGKLFTNERKLAAATKKYAGLSPLRVIHNRILLEAKRILLFEEISHKEIAFKLGFDSPSSFSAFIKSKTSHTPSSLVAHLKEIHK